MRLRHGAPGVPREASPDTDLAGARLYFITPDVPPARLSELAEAAVRGGADIVQLRQKRLPRGELLSAARTLRTITAAAGRLFIVNDHVDIALLSSADGVHLGPDDISIASAREVAHRRPLIIGASASSPEAAREAIAAGADYLGVGPAFETPVKSEKKVIGPEGVLAVANATGGDVPVFAIGGIDESNVQQLTRLGLHRVCVIRAIGEASDPEAAARRLRTMLDA